MTSYGYWSKVKNHDHNWPRPTTHCGHGSLSKPMATSWPAAQGREPHCPLGAIWGLADGLGRPDAGAHPACLVPNMLQTRNIWI